MVGGDAAGEDTLLPLCGPEGSVGIRHQCLRSHWANQAWALWLLGESTASQASPEVEPATGHYHQALALAEELGMRPLQAHCHRGLGMLYATRGQPEQARAALATAVNLYRPMEMTLWLPDTEAALAQVIAP